MQLMSQEMWYLIKISVHCAMFDICVEHAAAFVLLKQMVQLCRHLCAVAVTMDST